MILVIDTNVWVRSDSHELQKISEAGHRVYIPVAVFEEVKRLSEGKRIPAECFQRLFQGLMEGKFISISTCRTGIVGELRRRLDKEGTELKKLKEPLCKADIEEPDINDLRILAAAVYLKQEIKGECADIYLLTHDRGLAQFATKCGITVLGVKVWNGWARKRKIPWERFRGDFKKIGQERENPALFY
ncbi:MAG: PIN domain-containing protein [Patescibacteria group bacterium]